MVYILDKNGKPLMPTERHGKVRRLLKENKAKVVNTLPFTVQLLYDSTEFVQPVTLGIDSGSKHLGISAVANNKELFAGDHVLRDGKTGVPQLLESRRTLRRSRRNRKTRYRAPRFDNRARKPSPGYEKWFTPTTRTQIAGHEHMIKNVSKILPVSHIIVECGAFDTQLLKNPDIQGIEYQQGEMSDWSANVREYVLARDNYTCQWCKKSSIKTDGLILQTHHIQFRRNGGSDRPDNLITLCTECHEKYHKIVEETGSSPIDFRKSRSLVSAAHISTMKWELFNMVKQYDENANMTFGYKTKKTRISANRNLGLNLQKSSPIDARCITGFPAAKPLGFYYKSEQRRCHDRALFDAVPVSIPAKINPEGLIKNNSYFRPCRTKLDTHGFRDGDIVEVEHDLYMVKRRQFYPTRVTLTLEPWNDSKGTKKSSSGNKAKLISRNPDRISIVKGEDYEFLHI